MKHVLPHCVSVARCERSDHWEAVTSAGEDSEAESSGRERERDALHPPEDNQPRSARPSPARHHARHPAGLERERGADLPHLQVPSDYKEPVSAPSRPSGEGAFQRQNRRRFADKETVSKKHSREEISFIKNILCQVHLSDGRLRWEALSRLAGGDETLHWEEARDP